MADDDGRQKFDGDVLEITKGHIENVIQPLELMIDMLGPLGFDQTEVAGVCEGLLFHVREAVVKLDKIKGRVGASEGVQN